MNKLTKSDMETLNHLPEGWFEVMDKWSSSVNRPQFRIDQLYKKGILDMKVEGVFPEPMTTFYKSNLNK